MFPSHQDLCSRPLLCQFMSLPCPRHSSSPSFLFPWLIYQRPAPLFHTCTHTARWNQRGRTDRACREFIVNSSHGAPAGARKLPPSPGRLAFPSSSSTSASCQPCPQNPSTVTLHSLEKEREKAQTEAFTFHHLILAPSCVHLNSHPSLLSYFLPLAPLCWSSSSHVSLTEL